MECLFIVTGKPDRGLLVRAGLAGQSALLRTTFGTKYLAFPFLHFTALGRKSFCV